MRHVVNGDAIGGWYCYQCGFSSRSVTEAAAHDGVITEDGGFFLGTCKLSSHRDRGEHRQTIDCVLWFVTRERVVVSEPRAAILKDRLTELGIPPVQPAARSTFGTLSTSLCQDDLLSGPSYMNVQEPATYPALENLSRATAALSFLTVEPSIVFVEHQFVAPGEIRRDPSQPGRYFVNNLDVLKFKLREAGVKIQ